MSAYPYEGRDLFVEPETYSYAECAVSDYLGAWRRSRERAAVALETATSAMSRKSAEVPLQVGSPVWQSLVDIRRGMEYGNLTATEAAERIQPLLVKYEVSKRLKSHYRPDRGTHEATIPVTLDTYVLFADCLARIAADGSSLKHLSTLLKLNDALCSQPAHAFSEGGAAALRRILHQEERLVQRLEEDRWDV